MPFRFDLTNYANQNDRMKALCEDGWECFQVLVTPSEEKIILREHHFKRFGRWNDRGFPRPLLPQHRFGGERLAILRQGC